MKATGEVMAIGRTLEESLLKAVRSLELKRIHPRMDIAEVSDDGKLMEKLIYPEDDRLYYLMSALRHGYSLSELNALTKIDIFYLDKLKHIVELEASLSASEGNIEVLKEAKTYGFSDEEISRLWHSQPEAIRTLRKQYGIEAVYKMVDTCAGEFASETPYFYSSYDEENESVPLTQSVLVLGSGPIRIGQGVEFDYATVHCVKALQALGYKAIVINSNPETVSTDFSIADKLYFEPLTLEDVLNVYDLEKPLGVIVQFGGQTAINLALPLEQAGVRILGTTRADLDKAEDRDQFETILENLHIKRPLGHSVTSLEEALSWADAIGYPVLVRPSYVLGGRAMRIVYHRDDLIQYMASAQSASEDHPILIDRYLIGTECEVDALCDGQTVLIPGIMEHIERSGVHSGDSMAIYPPQSLSESVILAMVDMTQKLAKGLNCKGIMNIQFIVYQDEVYVIEVNPRSSRTVPFLSKVTGIPMAQVATTIIMGKSLIEQGYAGGLAPSRNMVYVKAPVFSFEKLHRVDAQLGPEMKSTGEVIGFDSTLEKALYKAFLASHVTIKDHGSILVTLEDSSKQEALAMLGELNHLGYEFIATEGTAQFLNEQGIFARRIDKLSASGALVEMLKHKQVMMVINTPSLSQSSEDDGALIRRVAIEQHIPLFTSLDTANAITKVLKARLMEVHSL